MLRSRKPHNSSVTSLNVPHHCREPGQRVGVVVHEHPRFGNQQLIKQMEEVVPFVDSCQRRILVEIHLREVSSTFWHSSFGSVQNIVSSYLKIWTYHNGPLEGTVICYTQLMESVFDE